MTSTLDSGRAGPIEPDDLDALAEGVFYAVYLAEPDALCGRRRLYELRCKLLALAARHEAGDAHGVYKGLAFEGSEEQFRAAHEVWLTKGAAATMAAMRAEHLTRRTLERSERIDALEHYLAMADEAQHLAHG